MVRSKYLRLAVLLRNEFRSPQELAELQARKLRRLITHAFEHVPFYRRLFLDAGVRPGDIRCAADLERLPVVNKDLLRSQPPEDLLDRRRHRRDLIQRQTSGSSGSPFRFYADAAFDQHCKAQYLRPYLLNGRRPLDRVLHFTAFPERHRRWFERAGLMRETTVGCSEPVGALLAALAAGNADVVQGYPSVLAAIAARIDPKERPFRRPRLVFTDSELLTPSARRRIEAAFGAPVFDVFGSFETDNIGHECRERSGFHLSVDCVVAEFVRDGSVVPSGESGHLVCTVLNNFAMPLIRYDLDDIAAAAPQPCACGRAMPLMMAVEGRRVDCVRLPDGSAQSPMQFLGGLDSIGDIAHEYQIVQTAPDRFLARLVPARELAAADRERIADTIRRQCPGARVEFEQVANIEREPSGKRRTFICRV